MKFVASVVTNEGTFNSTVISPLIAPTPQATRASEIAKPHGDAERAKPVHHPGREQEDLTGRQVDLGEHQQQHLADGDRADRPGITGRRAEAERAGELRPSRSRSTRRARP